MSSKYPKYEELRLADRKRSLTENFESDKPWRIMENSPWIIDEEHRKDLKERWKIGLDQLIDKMWGDIQCFYQEFYALQLGVSNRIIVENSKRFMKMLENVPPGMNLIPESIRNQIILTVRHDNELILLGEEQIGQKWFYDELGDFGYDLEIIVYQGDVKEFPSKDLGFPLLEIKIYVGYVPDVICEYGRNELRDEQILDPFLLEISQYKQKYREFQDMSSEIRESNEYESILKRITISRDASLIPFAKWVLKTVCKIANIEYLDEFNKMFSEEDAAECKVFDIRDSCK